MKMSEQLFGKIVGLWYREIVLAWKAKVDEKSAWMSGDMREGGVEAGAGL